MDVSWSVGVCRRRHRRSPRIFRRLRRRRARRWPIFPLSLRSITGAASISASTAAMASARATGRRHCRRLHDRQFRHQWRSGRRRRSAPIIQADAFVFGVEGDFDWQRRQGLDGKTRHCLSRAATATPRTIGSAPFAARAGYAVDRVLFYGTGRRRLRQYQAANTAGTFHEHDRRAAGPPAPASKSPSPTIWTGAGSNICLSICRTSCMSTSCWASRAHYGQISTRTWSASA